MIRYVTSATKNFCLALFSLLTVSVSLVGCGEAPPPVKDEEVTTDTIKIETKVIMDQIFINIPPPMDLSKELNKSGLPYNKAILNSSNKASVYSSNLKQAANLGAFGADLSYTAAYGQTQDALGYLNVIHQLADKVGVGAAFDESMIKRFEGNISNKDTMESIINDAYEKASRNLRSNKRISTAAIVSAGGWVEGLFISTQVLIGAEKNEKNAPSFQRVWNQLYAFRYVEELLTEFQSNPDCAQMLKDVSVMKDIVTQYGRQVTVNPDEVKIIHEKISTVRNAMIN